MKRSPIERQAKKRKCAVKTCRTQFAPTQSFVKWCSPACGSAIALGKLAKQKAAKAREAERADRAATRERKAALKTRADWIKEAQAAFNAFIRARDAKLPCICCDDFAKSEAFTGGSWDAGHYRSVGSAPHLRFNEDNCHRQRKQCNRDGAGRAVDYRLGLIARIGLARVEALESDQAPQKWSIEELKAIRNTYSAKLRALKEAS
jgi:hypothetical protein